MSDPRERSPGTGGAAEPGDGTPTPAAARRGEAGTVVQAERTPGPDRKPTGELGGEPVNADETAPRGTVPDPAEDAGTKRDPDAVEDEPGQHL